VRLFFFAITDDHKNISTLSIVYDKGEHGDNTTQVFCHRSQRLLCSHANV